MSRASEAIKLLVCLFSLVLAGCNNGPQSGKTSKVSYADNLSTVINELTECERNQGTINPIDTIATTDALKTKYLSVGLDKLNNSRDTLNKSIFDSIAMPYIRYRYAELKSGEISARIGYGIVSSMPAYFQTFSTPIRRINKSRFYSRPTYDRLNLISQGFTQRDIVRNVFNQMKGDLELYGFTHVAFFLNNIYEDPILLYTFEGNSQKMKERYDKLKSLQDNFIKHKMDSLRALHPKTKVAHGVHQNGLL